MKLQVTIDEPVEIEEIESADLKVGDVFQWDVGSIGMKTNSGITNLANSTGNVYLSSFKSASGIKKVLGKLVGITVEPY